MITELSANEPAMISKRNNKCIIKQLLNSVFVICKIIKVSVSVIDLDNSAYHKNLIQYLLIIIHYSRCMCFNWLIAYN
jgi:hypothetical protein